MGALEEALALLAEHADLISDVIGLVKSGASKDSIRKALADIKVEVSDAAFREELGLADPAAGALAKGAGP